MAKKMDFFEKKMDYLTVLAAPVGRVYGLTDCYSECYSVRKP